LVVRARARHRVAGGGVGDRPLGRQRGTGTGQRAVAGEPRAGRRVRVHVRIGPGAAAPALRHAADSAARAVEILGPSRGGWAAARYPPRPRGGRRAGCGRAGADRAGVPVADRRPVPRAGRGVRVDRDAVGRRHRPGHAGTGGAARTDRGRRAPHGRRVVADRHRLLRGRVRPTAGPGAGGDRGPDRSRGGHTDRDDGGPAPPATNSRGDLVVTTAPRVSAIVLAWLAEPFLRPSVEALLASEKVDVDVVLVDNGCTTDDVHALRGLPGVTVLTPPTNLGFTGGCNLGVANSTGEYVALINQDLIVEPGTLARLVDELAQPDVGVAAGTVFLGDDPGRLNSSGNPVHVLGISWVGGL